MRKGTKIRIGFIYFLGLYSTAFLINYIWEMAQMPFFSGMDYSDIRVWLICLKASIGDANIIIVIFLIGRLFFRNWDWPNRLTLLKGVYLVLIGGLIAALIEIHALSTDRWSYSAIMPVIPRVQVGVLPFIQMIVLPFIAYFTVSRFVISRDEEKAD